MTAPPGAAISAAVKPKRLTAAVSTTTTAIAIVRRAHSDSVSNDARAIVQGS
jgi:hypothetical protein